MLRDLKAAGKRVYVITATHDYQDDGQTNAYRGDEKIKIPAAKREELYDMYREFGPDEAISVHRDSMSKVEQCFVSRRRMRAETDSSSLL